MIKLYSDSRMALRARQRHCLTDMSVQMVLGCRLVWQRETVPRLSKKMPQQSLEVSSNIISIVNNQDTVMGYSPGIGRTISNHPPLNRVTMPSSLSRQQNLELFS